MNTRPVELRATTFADAQLISGWVSNADELLVFAGPKLNFPLEHVSGEFFGLRRRMLRRFGMKLEETEVDFPDDVAPTGWRAGDPAEPYPVDVPDNWWKTREQAD